MLRNYKGPQAYLSFAWEGDTIFIILDSKKEKKVLSLKVDTASIFQGCLLQKDPSEGSLEPGLALGRWRMNMSNL